MKTANEVGACRTCGAQLIDWDRVHRQDLTDVTNTFTSLRLELIRHHFWHVLLDDKAVAHARRKGFLKLRLAARSRIKTSVGPANLPFDGRQTPMAGSGNVIHYAQHATASCCRKCIEYWHNIPQKRALTDEEVEYLTELVMLYIEDRLPMLTDEGENIPRTGQKSQK
jgi:hypothetical protein